MLMTNADELQFYASHSCALFPIPCGSKAPYGIISSFAHDWSRDPLQWKKWARDNPNCNFGLVAGPSRLIVVDVDVSEVGREVAWRYWSEWCKSHDLPVYTPAVQSARGGWHILFSLPAELDISTLRQSPLIGAVEGVSKKAIVDLRVGNGFSVAAGSYYDGTAKGEQSGPYVLLPDAMPHPAPPALLTACARAVPRDSIGCGVDTYDFNDAMAFYQWMADNDFLEGDNDWWQSGAAAKLAFGDRGIDLWEILATRGDLSAESLNRWRSFSSESTSDSVTLGTFIQRARAMGWTGSVRKSSAAMFGPIAKLAASVGVTSLPSGLPVPPSAPGAIPMLTGQVELTRIATPMLTGFLSATAQSAPSLPTSSDYPTLPTSMAEHGLFDVMSKCITRAFALAEQPKFKKSSVNSAMGVLLQMHPQVFESVDRRFQDMGINLQHNKIRQISQNIEEQVQRVTVTGEKWERDDKQNIEKDNPDNVRFGLEYLNLEIRYNSWLERVEIKGGVGSDLHWSDWTYFDDAIFEALLTRWAQTKTRFLPNVDFAWRTLRSLAHKNAQDPVRETIDELAAAWDGTPRLITWLTRYCSVPCEPIYQAFGTLIIGGIVKRARHPGCKFDYMPIFFGPEGTGKSSMLSILAIRPEWFNDSILLGEASKELVLALAGNLVVEINEMEMRGSAKANTVKAFVTRQKDSGRTAYARSVSEHKRRNIFCGTTNNETPLEDPSGNRRFLPIPIMHAIDLASLSDDIGQLIGEAAVLESQGCTFDLPKSLWSVAAEHQEAVRAESDIEIRFQDWFGETDMTSEVFVTVADLSQLTMALGRNNASQASRPIMKRLGFRQEVPYLNGKKTQVWVRSPPMLPKHITKLTRYNVDTSTGSPRVTIRQSLGDAVLPPMPPMPPGR